LKPEADKNLKFLKMLFNIKLFKTKNIAFINLAINKSN